MTAALPDAELLAVTYLESVTAVTDEVSSRVYTELPSSPTFPLVLVSRPTPGSVEAETTLDLASLQVEVYGDTKQSARDTAATVQAALQDARGFTSGGGYVTESAPQGMLWLPDEDFHPPKPRYLFDVVPFAVRNT